MKKLLLVLLLLVPFLAKTQCDNGTNYYPSTIFTPSPDAWVWASTCNWAGEVIRVEVKSGDTYQFSTCGNYGGVTASYDTQLTLYDELGNVITFNDDYFGCAGFTSYINWTSTYTGTLYVHLNQYPCTSNTTCTRVMIYRTEQQLVSGPCTNQAFYTSRDFPTQQDPFETIACYYAGDYCQINNPEQGVSYQVTSENPNDWITIRSGTFDGTVEATGFGTAIIQSATAGVPYFIHVNVDDFCVVESVCRDVIIARQSALPIVLSYFDAYLTDGIEKTVVIEWETHSQQNNDYFTVYKSYDGYVWSELTKIQGAGNTNTLMSYTTRDENPRPGYQYYKLRQTDYDGNFEEFSPVSVGLEVPRLEVVKVYNQIGQEVSIETEGLLFLVWDNGEITKIINQ